MEENRAFEEEQMSSLDRVLESVGLNTPNEDQGREIEETFVSGRSIEEENVGEEATRQEENLTILEDVEVPLVEEVRVAVVESVREPVMEPVGEPVHVDVEEQVEALVNSQTGSFENDMANNFEDFQTTLEELKEAMENSKQAFGENFQVLNDKFVNLERKMARINPALREEISALKIELNLAIQKEKSSMAESIQAQKDDTSRLKGMYVHQMEQFEKIRGTLVEHGKIQDAEIQKLREEVACVYGTCDSMATILQEVLKELKEIKSNQVENTSLAREIRTQQIGDAHFFPKILDAAKTGGRMLNQFGSSSSMGTSSQGEGITFKTFSNPSGNAFSTWTAPKQASQPEGPRLTDQEREDNMVDLFAQHFGVLHDGIIDKEGRNPRECARWYLRNVFPANDIRDAAKCYEQGRVYQQFYHSDDKGNFEKLRKRINGMLGI